VFTSFIAQLAQSTGKIKLKSWREPVARAKTESKSALKNQYFCINGNELFINKKNWHGQHTRLTPFGHARAGSEGVSQKVKAYLSKNKC
jgi:hypothetical protein